MGARLFLWICGRGLLDASEQCASKTHVTQTEAEDAADAPLDTLDSSASVAASLAVAVASL